MMALHSGHCQPKDEDRDISAFRICEFVVQPGADDAASCHDGVFHGTGRDLTVCDDKSRENEGNDGGGYKNLDPADQLRYPACFLSFLLRYFPYKDDNLV